MRPTVAEIDLQAIRHNVRQIGQLLSPGIFIMAVVKANAYGHGAIKVSGAALSAGAHFLGVALPEEGAELREAGFKPPIFVLSLALPEQAKIFIDYDLVATICDLNTARQLAYQGRKADSRAQVMVKIDTGMGRIGLRPDQAANFVEEIIHLPGLKIQGIFTHLAKAEDKDKTLARRQVQQLASVVKKVEQKGFSLPLISAANSAALLDLKEAHFNLVRPGIILYGLPPSSDFKWQVPLLPAMTFKTRIVFIKEVPAGTPISYGGTYTTPQKTFVATLPVGYGDGYNRQLSNKASVLIGGRRRKVIGLVCMDQIMVDLGPICDVQVGDEVVLFGRQGKEEITVTELADLAGTINYELVCAVSSRVPRVYLHEEPSSLDHQDIK